LALSLEFDSVYSTKSPTNGKISPGGAVITSCLDIRKDMLSEPIEVRTDHSVDFGEARSIADERVRSKVEDPMLLAWFDRKASKFSPDVICCDTNKPTWLVYAESRGGTISVDINNEEYVFVYRPGM
jgi:hypothetical protein